MTDENTGTPLSLDPDTFVSAAFLEDKDVDFISFSFINYDYAGKAETSDPHICAEVKVDKSTKVTKQYWKIGSAKKFAPTENGKGIVALTKSGLSNASKGYLFLKSLKDAGIPADLINDGDITKLNGLNAHVVMLAVSTRIDGEDINYQVPIVSEINSMPGEAKTETKAEEKKETKEETPADDGLVIMAQEILKDIINGTKDKKLKKADLATLAFKAIPNDNPNKNVILGHLFDPEKTAAVADEKDGILTLK
jgi:hypothetical protein